VGPGQEPRGVKLASRHLQSRPPVLRPGVQAYLYSESMPTLKFVRAAVEDVAQIHFKGPDGKTIVFSKEAAKGEGSKILETIGVREMEMMR